MVTFMDPVGNFLSAIGEQFGREYCSGAGGFRYRDRFIDLYFMVTIHGKDISPEMDPAFTYQGQCADGG